MRALTDAERQTVTDHAWQVDVGAWHWCKKLGGPIDDHKSWGYEGLIKAVQQWDPDKEIPFEKWIQKKIGIQIYVSWRVWTRRVRKQQIVLVPLEVEYDDGHVNERPEAASLEWGYEQIESGSEIDRILELLTPRQRRIMPLLAEGYSRKEVAEMLGFSEKGLAVDCGNARKRLAAAGYDATPGPARCMVCATRFTRSVKCGAFCSTRCTNIARWTQLRAAA